MRLVLRKYQEDCVRAHYDWFSRNSEGHPLFVVPTGGGKSLIIAEFIRRSIMAWPDTRVLVLTHIKELIEQNSSEFAAHIGGSPWTGNAINTGIYSAGMNRRDTNGNVIFAGIQSVYNKVKQLGWFDIVMIDECHLVPKKGEGRYRTYLENMRSWINPNVKVCGNTATPYRFEGGYLHKGKGRIFTDIAYEVSLETLVDGGFLVPLRSKLPEHVIDTTGIKTVSGDFAKDELEAAAMKAVDLAVDGAVERATSEDRKHWLFFACGIRHAHAILARLEDKHSIKAEAVFGHTKKEERLTIVNDFRDGRIKTLVNVGVLTTGFNAPRCDLMAVMRPTKSTSLYVQIMGRGMRTFLNKKDCLVLDYGGNVQRHGPINQVRPTAGVRSKKKESSSKVLAVACPQCCELVDIELTECPNCGYEWPVSKETKSSELDPYDVKKKPEAVTWKVDSVFFAKHEKEDKPPSLRVRYMCGMRAFYEWVCIEHQGYPGRKAFKWWLENGGAAPVPMNVDEAIERTGELHKPTSIDVIADGKYERVAKPIFGDRDTFHQHHTN